MNYVVLSLAAMRLTLLLHREAGPFDLLIRLRMAMGMRFDAYGNEEPTGVLSEMLHCFWCLSLWVGAGIALLYRMRPGLAHTLSAPLALSGASIVLESMLHGNCHDQD